jgi:hypothetical protein
VQAGLDQMSYNWLNDAVDTDATLYTMLLYLDQNAYYNWELANLADPAGTTTADDDAMEALLVPYMSKTDGYAIKASAHFDESTLAAGEAIGQCLSVDARLISCY